MTTRTCNDLEKYGKKIEKSRITFTHFTPDNRSVEVVVKNNDVISYVGENGVIVTAPIMCMHGLMFKAGYAKKYSWYTSITGVNGIELDDM